MLGSDQFDLCEQLRRILSKFCSDCHRKHTDRDWLIRIVQKIVTGIEKSPTISSGNIDKLKQPHDISSNGYVSVVPLKLLDEDVEVGLGEFGMPLDTIAHGPRRTLGKSIDRPKKELHQLSESLWIVPDIRDDLLGLSL